MPGTLLGMAHQTSHIAALTVDLALISTADGQAPRTLKLLPAGNFSARDGRPGNVADASCSHWMLTAALASQLVAEASRRATRYVIDYDHQTLRAAENGKPAPASGWFGTLEWRPDGLYATDVEWTAAAAAMIVAKEYRYLSPVFTYDSLGRVTGLLHVALTNNPALDELPEIGVAALSRLLPAATQSKEDNNMEELAEQLRWLLNLPVGATIDDIKAQLQKLVEKLSGGQGVAAASVDIPVLLEQHQERIAALSANQADPARFVPVSTVQQLQSEVAALQTQLNQRDVDQLLTAALSDGRLLPAQEAWARKLGGQNVAELQAFLDTVTPIAALTATQTGGKAPATTNVAACSFVTPAGAAVNQDRLRLHQAALSYQQQHGVSYEAAVAHLEKQA